MTNQKHDAFVANLLRQSKEGTSEEKAKAKAILEQLFQRWTEAIKNDLNNRRIESLKVSLNMENKTPYFNGKTVKNNKGLFNLLSNPQSKRSYRSRLI